jgi:AcrR family transcriptional regulator
MLKGAVKRSVPEDGPTREERTRGEILAATLSLVERYGFAKLTLDDIAGALGKKKSFLYYYYPDKEAILAATVDASTREIQKILSESISKEKTGLAKIQAYILLCHQEIQKRLPIIIQLRNEIRAKNRETLGILLEKSNELVRMNLPIMEDLLREGGRDGSLIPFGEVEITAIARFISLLLHGIEYDYILGDADASFERDLRIALGVLEHGIAS